MWLRKARTGRSSRSLSGRLVSGETGTCLSARHRLTQPAVRAEEKGAAGMAASRPACQRCLKPLDAGSRRPTGSTQGRNTAGTCAACQQLMNRRQNKAAQSGSAACKQAASKHPVPHLRWKPCHIWSHGAAGVGAGAVAKGKVAAASPAAAACSGTGELPPHELPAAAGATGDSPSCCIRSSTSASASASASMAPLMLLLPAVLSAAGCAVGCATGSAACSAAGCAAGSEAAPGSGAAASAGSSGVAMSCC